MTFPVLFKTLDFGVTAAVIPWWLTGGVPSINCIAAYQPKGAADKTTAYTNLANPGTYNISEDSTAPTWSALTGSDFTGGASAARLLTGITIAANSWTVIAIGYIDGSGGGGNGRLFAAAGERFMLVPNSGTQGYSFNGTTVAYYPTIYTGKHSFAIANSDSYLDGSDANNITLGGLLTDTLVFGNRDTGTLNRCLDGQLYGAAVYNITLSGTQIGLLHTAMNAL